MWTILSVIAVQDAVAASLLKDGVFRAGLVYEGEPDFDDILADTREEGSFRAGTQPRLPR